MDYRRLDCPVPIGEMYLLGFSPEYGEAVVDAGGGPQLLGRVQRMALDMDAPDPFTDEVMGVINDAIAPLRL